MQEYLIIKINTLVHVIESQEVDMTVREVANKKLLSMIKRLKVTK